MTSTIRSAMLAVAALTIAAPAAAQYEEITGTINWTYAEVGYLDAKIDDAFNSLDADGVSLDAFAALDDFGIPLPLHVGIEASTLSFDDGGLGDLLNGSLRVGYHHDVGTEKNPATLFSSVSYEYVDFDSGDTESGAAIQVGARGQLSPNFELNLRSKYSFVDVGAFDEELSFRFGALYRVWGPVAAVLEYESFQESDLEAFNLGVRYIYK